MGSMDLPWEQQPAAGPASANQVAAEVAGEAPRSDQSPEELKEESRKIRRLQIMIDMVMSVIAQDPKLRLEEATQMANDAKRAALAMFPDKELAFDLLYKPRLQRLLRERYRII